MKKRFLQLGITSLFLACFGMFSCSSDDASGSSTPSTGTSHTTPSVPDNTDSGKNNNSQPDNINPSNTGGNTGDNTGSGGSNTGGSGDNTGGNTGGSGDGGGNTGGDNTGGGTGDNTGGSGDNTGGSTGGNTGSGSGSTTSAWTLVFEDNFGTAQDTTITAPSSQYWSLAQKGTDTWNRHMSESYNQAYQKGGYLYLFGMMEDGEYLTGGIESRNKFDFTYGQVKCRARFLRQPQGNHTGIWMMPQKESHGAWPRSGEIDIMEHLDDQDVYYSTVHYYDDSNSEDAKSDKEISVDHNEFNVYGVVWNNEAVAFTLNGEVVFTYKNENPGSSDFFYQYPFVDPFYLILSQSLGGKGTWEGVIDDSELPSIFQIDWIKVWQKN